MTEEKMLSRTKDGVGYIIFNNPEKHNAVSIEMWDALEKFLNKYSSFVFVGIMGYVFFAEIPSQSIIYGGILIILSGIYVAYRERLNN